LIDPKKYVVFKREEYAESDEIEPLDDCVVIRLQDVFAAGALYTYANSIRTTVEILSQRSPLENRDVTEIEYLNELADYFMEMAAKAESTGNKVPD
jgi:hypothetical protein